MKDFVIAITINLGIHPIALYELYLRVLKRNFPSIPCYTLTINFNDTYYTGKTCILASKHHDILVKTKPTISI